MATAHDLYKTIGNIDVSTESELLQVKVPVVFLVTGCFSRPRDGHYSLKVGRLAIHCQTQSNYWTKIGIWIKPYWHVGVQSFNKLTRTIP